MAEFINQTIPGLVLIVPKVWGDKRGFFVEEYNQTEFSRNGITAVFVQDNHSLSNKGVLRGLHFQLPPFTQDKLVRVIKGGVQVVVVDVRRGSPTFGESLKFDINEENKNMLFVPKGLAHGFLCLKNNTHFLYKVSDYYAPKYDSGIIWNDPKLNIDWGIKDPIISEKDSKLSKLEDFNTPFHFFE